MTKTEIQTLITAIGDGLANKAVKIRVAYSAFMNEFYSEIIPIANTANTVLTQNHVGINRFTLNKKGNIVYISGTIFGRPSRVLQNLFTIIDPFFYPKSNIQTQFINVIEISLNSTTTISNNQIIVNPSNNSITLLNPLPGNFKIDFNGYYFTND